jgi:hypothetical protein
MTTADWLTPERLVAIVIGVTLVEGVALWAWRRSTGAGVPAKHFVANWVSGLCLMGAVYAALSGAPLAVVALGLMASGAAHWIDVWRHWER